MYYGNTKAAAPQYDIQVLAPTLMAAAKVQAAGRELGLSVEVEHLPNPRLEAEEHYYNPDRKRLPELGFRPTNTLDDELRSILYNATASVLHFDGDVPPLNLCQPGCHDSVFAPDTNP